MSTEQVVEFTKDNVFELPDAEQFVKVAEKITTFKALLYLVYVALEFSMF